MSGAWSRRRAAVQAEAEADAIAAKQVMIAKRQEELAEKSEAEVLQALDLPQPDDMQAGDDFTAFMKEAVPAVLRNRALRNLWVSNPVLANVDGLVDYGEDFAAEGKLGGVVKTIYRVGKGMLTDEQLEEAEAALEADDIVEDDAIELEADLDDDEPVETILYEDPTPTVEDAFESVPIKRKMRFEFQEIGNE